MSILAFIADITLDDWEKWALGVLATLAGLGILGLISLVVWRIPSGAGTDRLLKLIEILEKTEIQAEKDRKAQEVVNTQLLADLAIEREERTKLQEAISDLTLENRKLKSRVAELEAVQGIPPVQPKPTPIRPRRRRVSP